MQKGKRIAKITGWLAGITVLVLAYTVAVTQTQKSAAAAYMTVSDMQDNDSVEVIGTPTGDDPWKEVEKIVKAYYSKEGITYKGMIKVIDDNKEQEEVIEENAFEYTMIGSTYHSRLGDMEYVQKKNLLLAIDHVNKLVSFSPRPVVAKSNKLFDIRDFKKMMQSQKVNARVTQSGKDKILTIDNISDPSIQGYRIYYSPETYRVSKMLIGMLRLSPLEEEESDEQAIADVAEDEVADENAAGSETVEIDSYYYYLEVVYTSVEQRDMKEKDFNPENKFISMQGGQPALKPTYAAYRFLNSIEP